jgi:small subunit ribosomal protein S9
VTGKKNATFEDYRKIKEKDYMRELEYFYPERNFDPRSLPQESRATKNSRGRKTSLSIYTGRYYFYETLYKIESTYEAICQSYPGDNCTPRTSTNSEDSHYWKSKTQLESAIGGPLLESEYQEIIALLNNIVKDPRSTHMEEVLQLYGSHASQRAKKYQKHETDSAGFLIAEGARKSSRATIKLRQGAGPFIVNDLPMSEYFSNIIHRQNIVDPFLAISPQEDFEMVAEVAGGGHKGQSEAIRLGVARALACMNETWRDALTKYRYLVRDPRCVERKKPGQKKARKKFTWVKR